MPSFVCDRCQETLKKAKLDLHAQRCRGASFSCIDCYRSFKGTDYREHISCITEVEKYEKKKSVEGTRAGTKRPADSSVAVMHEKRSTVDGPVPISVALLALMGRNKDSPTLTMKQIKKALKKNYRKKEIKKFLDAKILFALAGSSLVLSLDP